MDLAKLAKEREVVPTAQASLATILAHSTGECLRKNSPARLSDRWDEELDDEAIRYAATDAYAGLYIYNKLMTIPVPASLPEDLVPGIAIALYTGTNGNGRLVARGTVSSALNEAVVDGVRVTPARTVVTISEVVVPGAIMKSHNSQPLNAFGTPPFNIVVLRSHVRSSAFKSSHANMPSAPSLSLVPAPPLQNRAGPSDMTQQLSESDDALDNSESLGALIMDSLDVEAARLNLAGFSRDPEVERAGEAILQESPFTPSGRHFSRVKVDPWHVFHRFYISASHGLRVDFARALRDALFVPDAADKMRIEAWGASLKPPMTFDQLVRKDSKFVWRHCKRLIPEPDEVHPRYMKVIRQYGPLLDATTKLPVLNAAGYRAAKNVGELILNGYLSDPPDIALYTRIGIDLAHGGLPIYRTHRGTNFLEGGWHGHMRKGLPDSGVGPRHLNACMHDHILHHNLKASATMNSISNDQTDH